MDAQSRQEAIEHLTQAIMQLEKASGKVSDDDQSLEVTVLGDIENLYATRRLIENWPTAETFFADMATEVAQ